MSGFLGFDILWPVPSKQIMVRFWIVLLISGLPFGMPQLPASLCNNGTTYTKGSAFERNLNTVLDRLVHNGSLAGFNTSFYGQTPSTVYGLLQCRGDVSPSDCFTCSQDAGGSVRQQCGKAVGGRVWLELCYLRYENYRFFSLLDAEPYEILVNKIKITNPDVFRNATFRLLGNLAVKAVAPANKEFAAGSSYYADFRQVFGMVQCWRDISIENCRTCLNSNINVLYGYSEQEGARTLSGSCTARYEIYPFLMSSGAPSPSAEEPPTVGGLTPPFAKAPASLGAAQSPTSKKSSGNLPIILGIVGGVLLALIVCVFATRRKLKSFIFPKPVSRTQEEVIEARENVSESLIQQERTIFDLEALRVATGNFHDDNKLGEGGFGAVYKGRTSDGREIAVKKLSVRPGQGKKEFMNEVNVVAKIQHRNLVRLLGCCAEGAERLLVYEYLPNKSLDTFLFDPVKRTQLDWQKRYNIISGIARGLLYLHEDSQPRIIHRDIKANNILLDDKLNPKIADFGLARFFPEDESHVQTRAAGTYGYMAPEYAMGGQLSVKADVYSFGVVLLEIVSGRKNTDFNLPQESQTLLEWTWRLHKRGDILNIIDSTLLESCPQEQALRCIHVGLLCTQADAAIRPPISNVILMISSNSVTLPNPTKPAFVRFTQSQKSKSTSGDSDSKVDATSKSSEASPSSSSPLIYSSRNEASISDLEPR